MSSKSFKPKQGEVPATYFAPPERATPEELEAAVAAVASNPTVDLALLTFKGLLVVLDEHRQVVTLNRRLLEALGLDDPAAALGLRQGEMLDCVHATDNPTGGCGTGPACRTCGAAIAIVACQESDEIQDGDCVITARRGEDIVDLCFELRVAPLVCDKRRLLFVFLEDVTDARRKMNLERAFFHDVNNIVQALGGISELLDLRDDLSESNVMSKVGSLAERLKEEVAIQRVLALSEPGSYPLNTRRVNVASLLAELSTSLANHPAAYERHVEISEPSASLTLETDPSLTLRVLTNMCINALEASPAGGTIRVSVVAEEEAVSFLVWNAGAIPDDVARRIFERHFTTKLGIGRGTGTFTMKLFGERFLGGRVDFDTDEARGTTFRLTLPRR